jgi:CBS domain-containing protein
MFNSYEEIRNWRENMIDSVSGDHLQLNAFHDQLFHHAFGLAKEKVEREQGPPPAPFAFYLMGSAGRFEQSVWSDQDHGIVFDGGQEHQRYFLDLGEEIKEGLAVIGYERCEGNVMASNPLWCQSVEVLTAQISEWLREASWQKLRHFLIFFDSRVLLGEMELLLEVKKQAFSILEEEPWLFSRLIDNVNYVKKGVGVFGQLLPDYSGERKGNFNLKQTVYFPYVNALRILALLHHVSSPSTLSRFEAIKTIYPTVADFEQDFHQLLKHRLQLRNKAESYENVHMLKVDKLSKKDKQQLKTSIRRGQKLYSIAKSIIREEG